MLAGWDGRVRGAIAVADTIKPSAAGAVARLRGLGLHPMLLTGDNEATARAVAAAVGIEDVIAGTLPADKAAVITGLQARGHQVAMVGDGINDAPGAGGGGPRAGPRVRDRCRDVRRRPDPAPRRPGRGP